MDQVGTLRGHKEIERGYILPLSLFVPLSAGLHKNRFTKFRRKFGTWAKKEPIDSWGESRDLFFTIFKIVIFRILDRKM